MEETTPAIVSRAAEDSDEQQRRQRDLRLYDTDHDGKLNSIEQTIRRYDTDGDGSFSTSEVKAIVQDLQYAQREARNMWRLALGVGVVATAVFAALFAVMIAANEISKDTRPSALPAAPATTDAGRRQLAQSYSGSGSSPLGQVVLEDTDGNVVATDGKYQL